VTTEGADFEQLEPMIAQAERELEGAGLKDRPEVVLADAGYWSNSHIDALRERGMTPIVPRHADVLVAPILWCDCSAYRGRCLARPGSRGRLTIEPPDGPVGGNEFFANCGRSPSIVKEMLCSGSHVATEVRHRNVQD
jgi:hypothetical protein